MIEIFLVKKTVPSKTLQRLQMGDRYKLSVMVDLPWKLRIEVVAGTLSDNIDSQYPNL
jgi:hypothetical protein